MFSLFKFYNFDFYSSYVCSFQIFFSSNFVDKFIGRVKLLVDGLLTPPNFAEKIELFFLYDFGDLGLFYLFVLTDFN